MKDYFSSMKKSKSRQFSGGVEVTSHSLLWPFLDVTFILRVTRWLLGLHRGCLCSKQRKKRGQGKNLFLPS